MPERLQREIEEILEHSEGSPKDSPRQPGKKGKGSGGIFGGWLGDALAPSRLFMASGALLLTALILNVAGAGLAGLLFWLGLVLFIVAYAIYFVRNEKGPERRWRGRAVEYDAGPSRRGRIRRWFR
jgi:hypothetical protein